MAGQSVSLSGKYGWPDVEAEATRLGIDRSNMIQTCVDLYFNNKKFRIWQRFILYFMIIGIMILEVLIVLLLL